MGTKYDISKLPDGLRSDVEAAVKILKAEGCEEIYLFGSLIDGPISPQSDIDMAVRGIPSGSYFKVFAKLMMRLDHPVDLINLEKDNRFGSMLQKEGYLHRVA